MCEVFFLGTARRTESHISDSIEEMPRWGDSCDGKAVVKRLELGESPIHRRRVDRAAVEALLAEKRRRRDDAAEAVRARSVILQLEEGGESAQEREAEGTS
jgi:hypothetical protein